MADQPGTYLAALEVRDGEHWSRNEPGDGSRAVVEVDDRAAGDRGSLLTCQVTWPDGTTETVAVRGG